MKKYIVLLILPFLMACEKDSVANNNPYLPNYNVNYTVNLNLPSNNNLLNTAGGVLINTAGVGIRGIFVFNTGNNVYVAYDAACPNQALSDCSSMTLNGINAVCPCDGAEYSLFTGLSNGKDYPMKPYRTEVIGNTIRIYN